MYQLINHQRKEKQRSPLWSKNIIVNILLGFIGFLFIIFALGVGFSAYHIVAEFYGDQDVIVAFTGLLFYYFTFDLAIRFFAQQLPVMSIQPYRTLPVKKSKLLHYPLLSSIPGFLNFLPFFLIMPFFIRVVCVEKPAMFSIVWIITIICLIGINNFLNFSIKKYFIKKPLLILLLIFVAGLLLLLELQGILRFSLGFASIMMYIANNPLLVILPVSMLILTYKLAYYTLKKNYYPEESETSRVKTSSFSFLSRYGETGELMGVELKMILRNKRPRSILLLSLIFLGYGMILYDDPDSNFKLMIAGFILTFAFALNYGQFLFSWEGSYFDSYLANKISAFHYIRSKYLFIAVSGVTGYLLTLPYGLIFPKIILVNLAMLLYNVGISSLLILLLSTNNSTSIDLGKSQLFNYQGTGVVHFLMMVPLIGVPIFILILFKVFGIREYTFMGFGIIGLTGIIFSKYLLQMLAKTFTSRRYEMATGFRNTR
jgi:hypothetical protein